MRLDRYDSYLTSFHATVTGSRLDDRGAWLSLDRSAFYPTAGGQPHDTGQLHADGAVMTVVDVEAVHDQVWHLLGTASPPAVGTAVRGTVDWQRRYRHMQRHTAQHVLSAALLKVDPSYETRSVSMRGPDCTIDFAGTADLAALLAVETEANRAARRALAVMTFEVPDSRLGEFRLRRPAKVSGQVRLVAIGDYDLVACGGTHVKNSAEVLPVKVLGLERVKGGLNRLTFRSGEEAHEELAVRHAISSELVTMLSAPPGDLVGRVAQLQAQLADQAEQLTALRRQQAEALAQRLTAEADSGHVVAYLPASESALLDALVESLQNTPNTVSLLAAQENATGRVRFAFLAGPGSNADVRPALTAALSPLGGRGGGRPDRAQGAASADENQAREALATALAELKR